MRSLAPMLAALLGLLAGLAAAAARAAPPVRPPISAVSHIALYAADPLRSEFVEHEKTDAG